MFVRSLLTNYISDIVDGREARRELKRIAKTNPEQVLVGFKQLPKAAQREFDWVRQVAAASLEKQVGRG